MRSDFSNTVRVSLRALVALSVCLAAFAQEPPLDDLAHRMADSLTQSKQKSVAVFAFLGPDDAEALGQKLAGDFQMALAKSAHSFRVEERSQLLEILGRTSALSASVDDADTAAWFLRNSDVNAAILGSVSNDNGGLRVRVQAFRVRDADPIADFAATVPLTDELKQLVGRSAPREFANWPRGGKNGYSSPACVSCPQPQYTGRPLGRVVEGTVQLDITVDENGRARHIRIKKAMLDGLTEMAIAAVQKWKFKPATGPDGKVAAVREIVTLSFHFY
jgi:TonB family protein